MPTIGIGLMSLEHSQKRNLTLEGSKGKVRKLKEWTDKPSEVLSPKKV